MSESFRLGRIAGIDIDLNWSWLIIVVLLTCSLAVGWLPAVAPGNSLVAYWIAGFVATLLLFAEVLAHELGHAFVAKWRGLPVRNIVLHIFGGVSNLTQEPRSAGEELLIALVGPLVSLIIAGIMWALTQAFGSLHTLAGSVVGYLALSNLLLGIFNLVPGFPLDGGRVLRALLWAVTGRFSWATRWAARIGEGVACIFLLGGIWFFFTGRVLTGLWLGYIGWFLLLAAHGASRQEMVETLFRNVSVGDVMSPAPPSVPASLTLAELMRDYVLPHGWRAFPVEQLGELGGLVTLADLRQFPTEEWAHTPLSYAMIPLSRVVTAQPQEPLTAALERMGEADINQVLVVRFERPVGMLSRDAVLRFLQMRQERHTLPSTLRRIPYRLPRAS